jgi:polysaccharide biosynthesis protein PslG
LFVTVRVLVLAVLATLVLAAPASAARSVPHGFVGVHWSYELASAPADAQDAQWDVMASSGIESVRADFSWPVMQGRRGEALDFTRSDALVRRATLRNVSLLPVVNEAPRWARAYKRREKSPPRLNSDYASFIAGLVERYGPSGSFWTENPTLPKRPLREWQIWNEPHLPSYWDAPEKSRWGYPAGYGKLLRSAYRAVKVRDPGAKVVLAGITQRAWEEIEELYAVGRIKGAFDVAALQIFPQTVRRSVLATKLFREALRARRDGRKPIYLTELSWPASKGRTPRIRWLAHETSRSMAAKLATAYGRLAKNRRELGLERVYWFTWATRYGRGGSVFNYSGLQEYRDGKFTAQPALGALQRVARTLQGCAKDATGSCLPR